MKTEVVSVRGLLKNDRVELARDPSFIYVGRAFAGWQASEWGNPFRVQRQRFRVVDSSCCETVEEAVQKYERWVVQQSVLIKKLPELAGKRLGCWCGFWTQGELEIRCHAVILAKLANALATIKGEE